MQRQKPLFLAAIALGIIAALGPAFTDSPLGIAAPLLIIGATLIAFPFATPMTVSRNGVAQSILILRIFGFSLLIFGVVFLYLGLAIAR